MQAVRGEVHRIGRNDWVDWVNTEMASRHMNRALIGKSQIAGQFAAGASDAFELTRYDRKIEEWKDTLFHEIDFSITGSLAGLAESGSLVLWPDAGEPRLMSLVPPLHIAAPGRRPAVRKLCAVDRKGELGCGHADQCTADLGPIEDS